LKPASRTQIRLKRREHVDFQENGCLTIATCLHYIQ